MFEEWADYPLFLCFGQFCVGFARCFLYGKCHHMMKGENWLQFIGNVKKAGLGGII